MKEMLLEWGVCSLCACVLMIAHELAKTGVYLYRKKRAGEVVSYSHSIWEIYRYLDVLGILLAITCNVSFSKPFMFRIRDKKTNRVVGITGFVVLVVIFVVSICCLRFDILGLSSVLQEDKNCLWAKSIVLFGQYTAILSFGMFVANLFPVSTFDMGLLIAGYRAQNYLNIIKKDATIKVIFICVLLIQLIPFAGNKLIAFLL